MLSETNVIVAKLPKWWTPREGIRFPAMVMTTTGLKGFNTYSELHKFIKNKFPYEGI